MTTTMMKTLNDLSNEAVQIHGLAQGLGYLLNEGTKEAMNAAFPLCDTIEARIGTLADRLDPITTELRKAEPSAALETASAPLQSIAQPHADASERLPYELLNLAKGLRFMGSELAAGGPLGDNLRDGLIAMIEALDAKVEEVATAMEAPNRSAVAAE